MFQTFMMMNIFNMFNARKIGSEENPEYNIFENIFGNWWLLIIVLAELNAQFLMIGYPLFGIIFVTTPLTLGMHITAFCLGLSVLGVGAAIKATPFEWTQRIPTVEEKERADSSMAQLESSFLKRSETAYLLE